MTDELAANLASETEEPVLAAGADTDAQDTTPDANTNEEPPEEFDDDGNPIEAEDDTEELEFEGVKGKVPKALAEKIKLGAMRDADYRQKTMAVAEQRRQAEQEAQQVRANLAERTNLVNAHAADLVALRGLDKQLADYDAITPDQWNAARIADRENGTNNVDDARWEIDRLRRERAVAADSLQAKQAQMEADQQQFTANLVSQSRAVLERDIPGWNGQRLQELQSLALDPQFGFTAADIGQALHPGVYKVLNELAILRAQAKKTNTTATAQAKANTAAAAAPVQPVGGKVAPARKSPEQMSPEEYQSWRRSQKAQTRRSANGQYRA